MLEPNARRAHPVVDGMAYAFGGWSAELAASGISTIIATVDDFVSGYAETRMRMERTLAVIENDERLALIRTRRDLATAHASGAIGIVLGFQNSNPFEGRIERVEEFARLGVRCVQLTYNGTNAVGSGCLADADRGLTAFGRDVVDALDELGVLIDVSHCGERTTFDAVEASRNPIVCTHAGLAGVTANPRNKSDEIVEALAETGGLIGISAYGPLCWDPHRGTRPTLADVLRHVHRALELVGDHAVGFGGDWPVGVTPELRIEAATTLAANAAPVIADYNNRVGTSLDLRYPTDMPSLGHASALLAALQADGISETSVDLMVGGNFLRVFESVWAA